MGFKAPVTGGGGEREMVPAGSYLGICNGVYLLGTQPGFNGESPKQQVMLSFELHKRRGPAKDSAGRIMEASAIMSFTANIKSTLIEKFAGPLRGKPYTEGELEAVKKQGGFDVESLLGLPCKLEVVHTPNMAGKVKDKIKTVSAIDKEDDVVPEMETSTTYWDWTLDVECPKRIAWFWDKALENPARTGTSAMAGLAVEKKPYVAEDSPF